MNKGTVMGFVGSLLVGLSLAPSVASFLGGLAGVVLLTMAPYFKD